MAFAAGIALPQPNEPARKAATESNEASRKRYGLADRIGPNISVECAGRVRVVRDAILAGAPRRLDLKEEDILEASID